MIFYDHFFIPEDRAEDAFKTLPANLQKQRVFRLLHNSKYV